MLKSPTARSRRPALAAAATVAAAALSAVTLVGCTVGPDYRRPADDVKARFAATRPVTSTDPATQPSQAHDASKPVAQWWTTFNDPELEKLVERAAAGNLSLRRAALRIQEARAAVTVTGGRALPQVNGTGGYARAHGSKNVEIPAGAFGASGGGGGKSANSSSANAARANGRDIPATPAAVGSTPSAGGGAGGSSGSSAASPARQGGPQSPLGEGGLPGVNTDLFQVGVDASWEIDLFGGIRRDVEAAAADLQAAVEDRRDVLVTLLAEVARDYLQLRGLQRRLTIANQNLKVQEDTLLLVRSRQKAGFVTDLDVARAEALVAQTRASIPALEVQIRQTIHALGVLAGEDPTALADELAATAPIPGVPPRVPIGMPADLLRRRPDVRRAERQAAAATARVGVATAELYPRVSITGTFGFDSTKFKHLLDRQSYYFLLSPGVSWPIFEGGRIRANIDSREAAQQDALLAYRDVVLGALRDVEDALVAYAAEQARRTTLEVAAQANRNAVELARQQYQQGVVDFQVVLDTQRELLSAEDGLTQSEQAIASDLVMLYKALGGGWEAEPGGNGTPVAGG